MDRIDAMRLFVRLAERNSFSKAARDLRIKQSTASKWIATLEELAGGGLIDRTPRSLRLTRQGKRFLVHCQHVLGAFDEMNNDLAEQNPMPHGPVRVSAPVVFGNHHVVPAIASFLQAHPKVELDLSLSDRYVNLVEERFDLAVRVGVPTDTSARGKRIASGQRVLVAAPAYLALRGTPTTPTHLRDHECLLHGESAPMIWRFGRKRGHEQPVTVGGRTTANNSEAVLVMARAGLGIALLAEWLV